MDKRAEIKKALDSGEYTAKDLDPISRGKYALLIKKGERVGDKKTDEIYQTLCALRRQAKAREEVNPARAAKKAQRKPAGKIQAGPEENRTPFEVNQEPLVESQEAATQGKRLRPWLQKLQKRSPLLQRLQNQLQREPRL